MESVKEKIARLEQELETVESNRSRNQVRVNRGRVRKLKDDIRQLRIRPRRPAEKTPEMGKDSGASDV